MISILSWLTSPYFLIGLLLMGAGVFWIWAYRRRQRMLTKTPAVQPAAARTQLPPVRQAFGETLTEIPAPLGAPTADGLYCPVCDNPVTAIERFCNNCGNPLTTFVRHAAPAPAGVRRPPAPKGNGGGTPQVRQEVRGPPPGPRNLAQAAPNQNRSQAQGNSSKRDVVATPPGREAVNWMLNKSVKPPGRWFSGFRAVNKDLSEQTGSFLYFLLLAAIVLGPVIVSGIEGLSLVFAILFFALFPFCGAFAGYMLKRFRISKPARDLDAALKQGYAVAYHIGNDDKAKLTPFRRGATGRWHGPSMEITSDAIQKATYPFYGTVSAIVHSKSEGTLNAEFLYMATMLNANSEQIGLEGSPWPKGQKKSAAQIMDVIDYMDRRQAELEEMERVRQDVLKGRMVLDEYIAEKYANLVTNKDMTIDQDRLGEIIDKWKTMFEKDGAAIHEEMDHIKAARKVTIKESNFHIEYDTDLNGRVIGGRLVQDRVLSLQDFRNYLPTGGTAEDGFIADRNTESAARAEEGQWFGPFMKWFGPFIMLVGAGIMIYLIFKGIP
jgi:hypothetical protein